jgi:ParB/RepB/Spo0J family partition protein
MNTFNKSYMDIEHHQIELAFAHTRIAEPMELKKITASIDTNGQVVPVIVTRTEVTRHYILIDGYLRIQALKRLRQDIVKAEIWECNESDALLLLLANQGQRHWKSIEEAKIIRELQTKYNLSQEQISKKIGRSQTWVCHRIALIDGLSESLMDAIIQGKLSAWSAQRVLLPIARAIPEHAEYLLKYLSNHTHHTRELAEFLRHYQKSNCAMREKMVSEPELFFKAQKAMQADSQAKLLKAGPEGRWQMILSEINHQVKYLEKLVPQLFYERQDEKSCQQLLLPLRRIQNELQRILIQSKGDEHERQDDSSNHYHTSPIGQELSTH